MSLVFTAALIFGVESKIPSSLRCGIKVDREYDQAQEEIAGLRFKADELISDVMAELRFNLRKKDGSSQRRIMRTYGANFHYLKGEPVDEENL
jgi:hypothetical protein